MPECHLCDWCEEERPADKRCSGCSRVWYCSKKCQEGHWPSHIFNCNPRKPISTAYYLARAARRDMIPDHAQTLTDYGFDRASATEATRKLFRLYQGLLVYLDVKPRELHKWRKSGILIQQIKAVYEQVPLQSRGAYYPWFLQNEWVLDDTLPSPVDLETIIADARKRAWASIGGSPKDSVAHITAKASSWPRNKRACFNLYTSLSIHDCHPCPRQEEWLTFGFCAARDVIEESRVAALYHSLMRICTFNDFLSAFDTSSLIALMQSKGLRNGLFEDIIFARWSDLEDVLSGTSSSMMKSVWNLKQFVMANGAVELIPAIQVDYGFMNCKDETEFSDLTALYRGILEKESVNPIDLHHAAIQGQLFEFAKANPLSFFAKNKKKFRRLLKNPYPLAEF